MVMESIEGNMIERIIQDMDEGVMLIDGKGVVRIMNPAASEILDKPMEEVVERSLAEVFLDEDENDQFFQTVMDAIYDPDNRQDSLVPYISQSGMRTLHMSSAILNGFYENKGLIITFSDLTEITELKIKHTEQIMEMMKSMVRAFVTAVDARSPYNVNHTRNMISMGYDFLLWLNETDNPLQFDKEKRDAFLMSIALHDIGKLSVPLSVMDKPTRLAWHLDYIKQRFNKINLLERISCLEGKMTAEEYEEGCTFRKETLDYIEKLNTCGYCSPEDIERVRELGSVKYLDEKGDREPLLTEKEVEMLSIVKGTLTDKEREQMQNHVVVTSNILNEISFPECFSMVPKWAGQHHEYLNGKGYPAGLSGDQICTEVRIITILDIFEAITSRDRPYKKFVSPEQALSILDKMADEGSIDRELLELFKESRVWENE